MTPALSSPRAPLAVSTATWGGALVTAYALLAVLQILVLNPLAAVPGASLAQVQADMAAVGESFRTPLVLAFHVPGPLLALGLWRAARRRLVTFRQALATVLGLLLLGSPLYFLASFGPGMAIADTYGIGGGDHSPWAIPLHVVSSLALIGLAVLAAARHHGQLGPTARVS